MDLKNCSHQAIATAIYFLQLMGCMGYRFVVTVASYEHLIWIPHNPLVTIKNRSPNFTMLTLLNFIPFFREARPTGGTSDISSIIPNRTWSRRTRTLCSITFSSSERNYPSSGEKARRARPPSTSNNTTSGAVRSFINCIENIRG